MEIYLKKWWLETTLPDGRRFWGFINTEAHDPKDFPETITGTFWTKKSKNEQAPRGYFELGDKVYDENFTIGNVYPKEKIKRAETLVDTQRFLKQMEPLNEWERIELKIEDCLNLDKTYIMKV